MVCCVARIYCRVIVAFTFDACLLQVQTNEYLLWSCLSLPHSSCARLSGPSFRRMTIVLEDAFTLANKTLTNKPVCHSQDLSLFAQKVNKQSLLSVHRMQQILIHTSEFHAAFSVACWKVDGFRLHLLNANTLAFTRSESRITIHTSI